MVSKLLMQVYCIAAYVAPLAEESLVLGNVIRHGILNGIDNLDNNRFRDVSVYGEYKWGW